MIDPKVGHFPAALSIGRQGRNDGHVFLTPSLKFHNIALELGAVTVNRAALRGGVVKHAED